MTESDFSSPIIQSGKLLSSLLSFNRLWDIPVECFYENELAQLLVCSQFERHQSSQNMRKTRFMKNVQNSWQFKTLENERTNTLAWPDEHSRGTRAQPFCVLINYCKQLFNSNDLKICVNLCQLLNSCQLQPLLQIRWFCKNVTINFCIGWHCRHLSNDF